MVVGLVTKYAGGVVKGFALIAGMYASFLYSVWMFLRGNLCCVGMSCTGIHTYCGVFLHFHYYIKKNYLNTILINCRHYCDGPGAVSIGWKAPWYQRFVSYCLLLRML